MSGESIVIKVGGSLFDLPDLGNRLLSLLKSLPTQRVVIVPGGGDLADVIRHWDRCHQLGEVNAHRLAMRTLSISAHCVASFSPRFQVIESLPQAEKYWCEERVPVIDSYALSLDSQGPLASLPESWNVTSDSIAAAIARHMNASRLVMLKSVSGNNLSPTRAAEQGIVDPWFPHVAAGLTIEWVNLRGE